MNHLMFVVFVLASGVLRPHHAVSQSVITTPQAGMILVRDLGDFARGNLLGVNLPQLLTNEHIESQKPDSAYDDLLYPDDADAEPQTPPGSPQLPSACAPPSSGWSLGGVVAGGDSGPCEKCGFAQVYADLTNVRQRFEKLRRIYAATKSYVGARLARGDSIAGSLGVGGLAWQKHRRGIEESFRAFEVTYDAKHEELSAELLRVLQNMAKCQEQVYGDKDWYNRYGFMYYQFMTSVYQRAG